MSRRKYFLLIICTVAILSRMPLYTTKGSAVYTSPYEEFSPDVVVTRDGDVVVAFIQYASSQSIVTGLLQNGSVTAYAVINGSGPLFHPSLVELDNGSLLLAYQENSSTPRGVYVTFGNVMTWNPPVLVAQEGWCPSLAILPNGTPMLTYVVGGLYLGINYTLYIDGHWTKPVNLAVQTVLDLDVVITGKTVHIIALNGSAGRFISEISTVDFQYWTSGEPLSDTGDYTFVRAISNETSAYILTGNDTVLSIMLLSPSGNASPVQSIMTGLDGALFRGEKLAVLYSDRGDLYTSYFSLMDLDKDGLPDDYEIAIGTDPAHIDTNKNGILDGEEDMDNDGLTNIQEYETGTLGNNPDTDEDGLNDGKEVALHTNPLNPDTDGDGIRDGDDLFPTIHFVILPLLPVLLLVIGGVIIAISRRERY